MNQEPKTPSFGQIVKHPVTYMLIVAVSLLWFFVYQFKGSSQQRNEDCENNNKVLRLQNEVLAKKLDDLTTALLVKNGIIFKQEQDMKDLDTTMRVKVGQKAKKIVKEN